MTTLVTQSFGSETEYRRAIFAIWSYWAFRPMDEVMLFTDSPSFFELHLKGGVVRYVPLTVERIRHMRGEIDFLHHMKIAMIEEAFRLSDHDLVYVDSDTFFKSDPTSLIERVSPEMAFMHTREYQFEQLQNAELPAGKTSRDFFDLINNRAFNDAAGRNISVTPKHFSWNAGAMMLHRKHSMLLQEVYSLTEQFYPATKNHASEQYAFSVVLQNKLHVEGCDEAVYHYYYRVEKEVMDVFLRRKLTKEWIELEPHEKVLNVRTWIVSMPAHINGHTLILRDRAIQAFHQGRTADAYILAFKAIVKNPFGLHFLKNILYHTKRLLYGN